MRASRRPANSLNAPGRAEQARRGVHHHEAGDDEEDIDARIPGQELEPRIGRLARPADKRARPLRDMQDADRDRGDRAQHLHGRDLQRALRDGDRSGGRPLRRHGARFPRRLGRRRGQARHAQKASAECLHDERQRAHLREHPLRHRLIHRHEADRIAALLGAAEMEGRDVDARLGQHGAEMADEARLVLVRDVEHVRARNRLRPGCP